MVITKKAHVVYANISFSVVLDLLDRYGLYVNNVKHTLGCPKRNIEIPLEENGHRYFLWDKESKILYTRPKLVKLHKNFSHPAPDKLFNLLKLQRPWEDNTETRKSPEKYKSNAIPFEEFLIHQSGSKFLSQTLMSRKLQMNFQ